MVRIATFNLRHGAPDADGWRGQIARHRAMVAAVSGLDADVVALQEVDRHLVRSWWRDQAATLGRATGSTAIFAGARRVLWTGHDGPALLVRGDVVRQRVLALPGSGPPRRAIFAAAEVSSMTMTLVSTHLQNPNGGADGEALSQLGALLDELSGWPEPWVLGGDLNLRPGVVLPVLDAAGLVPLRAGPTQPANTPRKEIDWLAVRGLRAVSTEVRRMSVSDHRVLLADVVPD